MFALGIIIFATKIILSEQFYPTIETKLSVSRFTDIEI